MLRLNPCCSGQWSRTIKWANDKRKAEYVLILVVVDNGLVLILTVTQVLLITLS